jgi:hypothetical protein
MSVENQNPFINCPEQPEQPERAESMTAEPFKGLLDRDYERVVSTAGQGQGADTVVDQPILNSFRGSVSSDRLRHENAVQSGGLAHWRHDTPKQQRYDDQVLHAGMGRRTEHHIAVQRSAVAYSAPSQTPGMGLEAENLLSFITTGSHSRIEHVAATAPKANEPVLRRDTEAP